MATSQKKFQQPLVKQPRDSVDLERPPVQNDDPSNAVSNPSGNLAQFKNSKLFQKFMAKEQTKATTPTAAEGAQKQQQMQTSVATEIAKAYKVNQRLNPQFKDGKSPLRKNSSANNMPDQ